MSFASPSKERKVRRIIKHVAAPHESVEAIVPFAGAGVPETAIVTLPMLAHDFKKPECAAKINFPALAQRKIDGWRCLATCPDTSGEWMLVSRSDKVLSNLEHIKKELASSDCKDITLDGELYSDHLSFQQLSAFLQKKHIPTADAKAYKSIFYLVFDVITPENTLKRQAWLTEFFAAHKFKHVKLLPHEMCATPDDAERLKVQYVTEGYEGVMLRNTHAPYEGKRTYNLQKFKSINDAEFKVISWQHDSDGGITWECETTEGKPFHAKPQGSLDDRKFALMTAAEMVGKYLTVKYQELSEAGVPRFPVAVGFRGD